MPLDAGGVRATLSGRVDEAGFKKFEALLKKAEKRVAKATLKAEVQTRGFTNFDRKLASYKKKGVEVRLRGVIDEVSFKKFDDLLKRYAGKGITVPLKVDVDDSALEQAEKKLDDFTNKRRSPGIEVDAATKDLDRFSISADRSHTALTRLRGSTGGFNRSMLSLRNIISIIKWPAIIVGAGLAAQAISALTAGVVALTGALGPLGASLAAAPGLLAGLGTAVGTAVAGFSGIGEAVKTAFQVEDESAQQATASLDQNRQSTDAIAAAKQNLADAQDRAQDAQENLTEARRQATRQLTDMRLAAEGAALSESRAEIGLREARARLSQVLRDSSSSDLDIDSARLAVREASLGLREARKEKGRTDADLRRAEQAGVKGSDQMKAARKALAEANRSLKDSTKNLADAHRDAAQATREQSAAQDKLQESMKKLSPAGRAFVKQLVGMREEGRKLREAAQESFLPGVSRGLKEAEGGFDSLRRVIRVTGKSLGEEAEQFGKLLGSDDFGRDFEILGAANAKVLDEQGHALRSLLKALTDISVAAIPFVRWMSDSVEAAAELTQHWAQAGRESGRFAAFLERTEETMRSLWDTTKNLGGTLVGIGRAGRSAGEDMLAGMEAGSEKWEEWAKSAEGQNSMRKYFQDAKAPLHEFNLLIGDAAKGFLKLGAGDELPKLISSIRTKLLPAFLDLIEANTEAFGPALIEALTQILLLIAQLAGQTGPLTLFVKMISSLAEALNFLLETIPGLHAFILAVAGLKLIRGLFDFTKANFGLRALKTNLGLAAKEMDTTAKSADKLAKTDPTPGSRRSPGDTKLRPLPAPAPTRTTARDIVGDNPLGPPATPSQIARHAENLDKANRQAINRLKAGPPPPVTGFLPRVREMATGMQQRVSTAYNTATGRLKRVLRPFSLPLVSASTIADTLTTRVKGGVAKAKPRITAALKGIGGFAGFLAAGGALSAAAGTFGGEENVRGRSFGETASDFGVNFGRAFGFNVGKTTREKESEKFARMMAGLSGAPIGRDRDSRERSRFFGRGDPFRATRGPFLVQGGARPSRRDQAALEREELKAFTRGKTTVLFGKETSRLSETERANLKDMAKKRLEALRTYMKHGVRVPVTPDVSAKSQRAFNDSLTFLKKGTATTVGQIRKIMAENSDFIARVAPKGSEQYRKLTAQNLQAAAKAYRQLAKDGVISMERAEREIQKLNRRAKLAIGKEPFGFGADFIKKIQKSGGATTKTVDGIIRELRKMPPGARRQASEAMVGMLKEMEKRGKLPKGTARKIASEVATEFKDMRNLSVRHSSRMMRNIGASFEDMVKAVENPTSRIGQIVANALRALGEGRQAANVKAEFAKSKAIANRKGGGGMKDSSGDPISSGLARGGVIPGAGNQDTVRKRYPPGTAILNKHQQPFADKATKATYGLSLKDYLKGFATGGMIDVMVAPGEVEVDSRKGVPGLDYAMQATYGMGLDGLFSAVQRPHYLAKGGFVRIPGDPSTTGGRDKVSPGIVDRVSAWVKRYDADVGYAFDPGGGHKSAGHNVTGTATDVVPGPGGSWDKLERGLAWLVGQGLTVLYGSNGIGSPWPNHGRGNHAHIEWGGAGGGGRGDVAAADVEVPQIGKVTVKGEKGAKKDIVRGSVERVRKAANKRMRKAGRDAGGDLSGFKGGGSESANRRLGRRMMLRMWGPDQWGPLEELWQGESGWDETADNPTSDAYGIPQSLPGSKMASEGKDWRTNPATQIAWGLKYIKQNYGSPAKALATWKSRSPHWYALGGFVGRMARGGIAAIADTRSLGKDMERMRKKPKDKKGKKGLASGGIISGAEIEWDDITPAEETRIERKILQRRRQRRAKRRKPSGGGGIGGGGGGGELAGGGYVIDGPEDIRWDEVSVEEENRLLRAIRARRAKRKRKRKRPERIPSGGGGGELARGGFVGDAQAFFARGGRIPRTLARMPGGGVLAGLMGKASSLRDEWDDLDGQHDRLLGVERAAKGKPPKKKKKVLPTFQGDPEEFLLPGRTTRVDEKTLDPDIVYVVKTPGGRSRKITARTHPELFNKKKADKTPKGKKTKKGKKAKRKKKVLARAIGDFDLEKYIGGTLNQEGLDFILDSVDKGLEDLEQVEADYALVERDASLEEEQWLVTENELGTPVTPHLDEGAISKRVGELQKLIGAKVTIVETMRNIIAKAQGAYEALVTAVEARIKAVTDMKAKVSRNLSAIKERQDDIEKWNERISDADDALELLKKKGKLDKNDRKKVTKAFHKLFPGVKMEGLSEGEIAKRFKSGRDDWVDKRSRARQRVAEYRKQNLELGGDEGSVGDGGMIGDVSSEKDEMEGHRDTMEDHLRTLRGAGGPWLGERGRRPSTPEIRQYRSPYPRIGDELFDLEARSKDNPGLYQQLEQMMDRSFLDKEVKKAQSNFKDPDLEALNAALKEELEATRKQLQVVSAQSPIIGKFLGAYEKGGVLPKTGFYLGHKGEVVIPPPKDREVVQGQGGIGKVEVTVVMDGSLEAIDARVKDVVVNDGSVVKTLSDKVQGDVGKVGRRRMSVASPGRKAKFG